MNHGSLFSGIGGFDLAAQWMGWKNVFHCEINPFCRRILSYYWPNAKSYEDIKKTNFTEWRGAIDILSGGFPCQPFSAAGRRRGTEDERHLWPEMLRAIREIQPEWIVGENVFGLVNWNRGMVFDQVQVDLENQGYEVQTFVLPACGVGAHHRRDRVWIVAHTTRERRSGKKYGEEESGRITKTRPGRCAITTNPDNIRLQGGAFNRNPSSCGPWGNKQFAGLFRTTWENFPTKPPICGGINGLSVKLDGITFSKWRSESIKSYGNAIVPNIAFEIFKAIKLFDDEIQ